MQMTSGSNVLMTLAMPTPTYSIQLSMTFRAVSSPLAAASKASLALTWSMSWVIFHIMVFLSACMAAFVSRVSALAEA